MRMVEEHHMTGIDAGKIRVRIVADHGDGTSRVEARDCGAAVRAGQHYNVPTDAITRH